MRGVAVHGCVVPDCRMPASKRPEMPDGLDPGQWEYHLCPAAQDDEGNPRMARHSIHFHEWRYTP